MKRWRLCTLAQTEIDVHPAILLYFLYACITGHLLMVGVATVSILLHESAHALMAGICGRMPCRIELTPMGAAMFIDERESLPVLKQILIIAAGPAATFVICMMTIYGVKSGTVMPEPGRTIFFANSAILMTNLLPALPLDGGRLLSGLLEVFFPKHVVCRMMQVLGYCIGASFIGLNVWTTWKYGGWNLSLAFAGCCLIYNAANASVTWAIAELRYFMDRKIRLERKGSLATVCITCVNTERIARLLRRLPVRRAAIVCCLEAGSMKRLGWIDEFELIQHYLQNPTARISDVISYDR